MNINSFLILLIAVLLQSVSAITSTTTRWHTTSRLHTETTTSTIRKGVLMYTVYKDIYDDTTLLNTISASSLTRISASSLEPITSLPAIATVATSDIMIRPTATTTRTTSNKLSSLLSSSAKTTTSVIFSSSGIISTSIAGSTGSSVSQDTSKNPLITSSIVVSTSNTVSINTATLISATVIPTSITTNVVTSKSSSSLKSSSIASSSSSSVVSSSVSKSSSSVQSSSSSSSSSSSITPPVATSTSYSGDLFLAVDTNSPPSVYPREDLYISQASGVDNGDTPYETNKFFTNMMLGDQSNTVFIHPYSVWWDKTTNYGLSIGHTTSSQYVFGSHDWATYGYYFNPLKISQLVFSATTFDSSASLGLTQMKELSALATLSMASSNSDYVEFPLVEGMGFVTGIYHGDLVPEIKSDVAFLTLSKETSKNLANGILKYRISLNNGVDWLIYITLPDGYASNAFSLKMSNSLIQGSSAIDGLIIQLAIAPDSDSAEVFYDTAAGMYSTSASVSGSVVDSTVAEYLITYSTSGKSLSGEIIVHLLPHQVDSLSNSFTGIATNFYLDSTTKGKMYAYLTTQVIMAEILETDIQFLPWLPGMGELSYTADQLALIGEAANLELEVDIKQTVADLDSTYYSGKVIDKYAYILLTVSEIIGDEEVSISTLENLKEAFSTFTSNSQYYPFIYDTRFKGVTSSGSQSSGDSGVDFGSSIYNDHHFHYGYFIHAAAIVGYVDAKYNGTWAQDNKDWVNSLIRDVANPSSEDNYFPVSRMFDWFHGHSWASGLDPSGDGKNQESSSEDYNFAYGMKLWGRVIGDQSMESRGDLMLAVTKRAMNMYYLFSDDNEVEPANIIGNKVAGIVFENKMDYTTYFGSNLEYIHGIHMLPITPASSLVRGKEFVQQEWTEKLSSIAEGLNSGWAGILHLNQALFDPASSYSFFSSPSFSNNYLDNGQSHTWCLAFSAGVLNASV